ncbi:MAG: recombinase family protein [Candidatus Thiodiazotropha sp. (ex. Lucinisca nassula)]|nr:recombinase family protein [Candidatus Thiodiazotropha sp. (ex. Lucinisca nassula)]
MIFNYIRVSTVAQNTDRQLVGVSCDREYLEKVSAKDAERVELTNMLNNLRSGDTVNVHELSRLARNTQDLLKIVDEIIEKGASIKFHKENLTFDGSKRDDAFQKLMLTMLGAISTFERDLMLERQREGIAIAKQKGKYKGRRSRFSDSDVEGIKERYANCTNKAELARELGISRAYLYRMVSRV